jgi:hypothetical protein
MLRPCALIAVAQSVIIDQRGQVTKLPVLWSLRRRSRPAPRVQLARSFLRPIHHGNPDSPASLSDLEYDLLTVLQNKVEAIKAHDVYIFNNFTNQLSVQALPGDRLLVGIEQTTHRR